MRTLAALRHIAVSPVCASATTMTLGCARCSCAFANFGFCFRPPPAGEAGAMSFRAEDQLDCRHLCSARASFFEVSRHRYPRAPSWLPTTRDINDSLARLAQHRGHQPLVSQGGMLSFELQQRQAKFERESNQRKEKALAQLQRERAEQDRCDSVTRSFHQGRAFASSRTLCFAEVYGTTPG